MTLPPCYRCKTQPSECRVRIEAFREHHRRYCVSDYRMRRCISRDLSIAIFDHIRFRVGSVVRTSYATGLWLVVGHGYTGAYGTERGCHACQITDRIFKRWQWIGPESHIRRVQE